jgi:DNA-binding NarL/FixJ family response regulator
MRIVIVDHHPLFREGMALIFSREPDFTIVGHGGSADEAVQLISTLAPDIALIELSIPGGGLNALQQIDNLATNTRVIMLSNSDDEAAMLLAMKAGARGYVLNTIATQQLVTIIRDVHSGATHVSQELAMRVLMNVANPRATKPLSRLNTLSEREQQILAMVSSGSSNRQIATALNRTEAVIKNHMTIIMKKLQVNNRVQAAMILNQET